MVPTPLLWICGFVAAAVFAVMIHSIATFRRGAESIKSMYAAARLASSAAGRGGFLDMLRQR